MTVAHVQTRTPLAQEYWRQGYVAVRGRFSREEVAAIQRECKRLFALFTDDRDRYNLRVQFRNHERGQAVLDRIDPIRDLSPLLGDLAQDARLREPVAEVLGGPGLLFKDKLILKGPGTHGYGVHQDYTNWQEVPVPPEALLSVLFAVDDSSAEKGGLEFFPGFHHAHYREHEKPSNIFDPQAGLVPAAVLEGHTSVSCELEAGDLVLFHSLTPHQSGINHSRETRCSIYYSYSEASYGDVYETYYRNFYGYLRKDRAADGDLLHVR